MLLQVILHFFPLIFFSFKKMFKNAIKSICEGDQGRKLNKISLLAQENMWCLGTVRVYSLEGQVQVVGGGLGRTCGVGCAIRHKAVRCGKFSGRGELRGHCVL